MLFRAASQWRTSDIRGERAFWEWIGIRRGARSAGNRFTFVPPGSCYSIPLPGTIPATTARRDCAVPVAVPVVSIYGGGGR